MLPPYGGATILVTIDQDHAGPAAGFADALFIRLPDLYPEFDIAGQRFFPQRRFLVFAEAPAELKGRVGMQRVHAQTDHQAFLRF